MENPFEILSKRLSNIECLLLDIKHGEIKTDKKYSIAEIAKYIGVSELKLINLLEAEKNKIINN